VRHGLSEAFAKGGAAAVTGLDFTEEMLEIARQKAPRHLGDQSSRVTYIQGDAQALPFPDGSFDVVSIAFGIRNVQDPAQALREFRRVLKPGGRVVVLEFAQPGLAPIRWFNSVYCSRIMPITATWISGDKSGAYKYLPKSVETFTPEAQFLRDLSAAGLVEPQSWHLSLGICNCYRARVPVA
jgi:demethylmenaquinone methyltransferase/2-methoxy-6-polyprenyl-1,4-benzoquinol methylase